MMKMSRMSSSRSIESSSSASTAATTNINPAVSAKTRNNMNSLINSDSALSPRWKSPDKDCRDDGITEWKLLWAGISRSDNVRVTPKPLPSPESVKGKSTNGSSSNNSKTSSPPKSPASSAATVVTTTEPILLVDHETLGDPKTIKAARRFLKKPPKSEWDFYTYATQSQSRLVQAVKIHVYERLPIPNGERARLVGLVNVPALNGVTVRILEYDEKADKYLIRPTIPLQEKLSSTGQLLVRAHHVQAFNESSTNMMMKSNLGKESKEDDPDTTNAALATGNFRIWTFACLYDGKKMNKQEACRFIEKLVVMAEGFRHDSTTWLQGAEAACTAEFCPLLEARMSDFQSNPTGTLEYCKYVLARNKVLLNEPEKEKKTKETNEEDGASVSPRSVIPEKFRPGSNSRFTKMSHKLGLGAF